MEELPKKTKQELNTSLLEKNIRELLVLLDGDIVKWEDDCMFEFNGTEFYILITPKNELAKAEAEGKLDIYHEPAEYYESTLVNGFDIYLHDTIPKSDRKRVLFHEILEVDLRQQGLSGVSLRFYRCRAKQAVQHQLPVRQVSA